MPPYSGSATLPSGSRVLPSGSRLRIAVTDRPSASRVSNSSARPASTSCWMSASRSGPGGGSACDFQRITKYPRSEEHTSELQSHSDLVCRLLLEKKKKKKMKLISVKKLVQSK